MRAGRRRGWRSRSAQISDGSENRHLQPFGIVVVFRPFDFFHLFCHNNQIVAANSCGDFFCPRFSFSPRSCAAPPVEREPSCPFPSLPVRSPGDPTLPAASSGSVTTRSDRYRLDHYRKTRYWAVHEDDDLLVVTVYKRGARAVVERLQALDQQLAAQRARLVAPTYDDETTLPRAAEPPAPDFPKPVTRPVEQLPLFPLPERAASRRRRWVRRQSVRP